MRDRAADLVSAVPLFDRLVDEAPDSTGELRPLRAYTRSELRASVARELSLLLNTRCPVGVDDLDRRPRSVIDYGLPDLSYFASAGRNDTVKLERLLRETIEAFEPRLTNIRINLAGLNTREGRGLVEVAGDLRFGGTTEPVSFPILLDPNAAGEAGEVAATAEGAEA